MDLSNVFGRYDILLEIFLVLLVVEVISRIVADIINENFSSDKILIEVFKKLMMLMVIIIAHLLDLLLHTNRIIQDGVITFFIINEFSAILESATRSGIPIPGPLEEGLKNFRQKITGGFIRKN
jgi:toxin secretion/phage lysis holin